MKSPPAGSMATVTVERVSGDASLSSPIPVYFRQDNWDSWRAGTILAAEDANTNSETATFRVTMPGADPVYVEARTLDIDGLGDNVALASSGATVSGETATRIEMINDGIHDENGNYAHTIWNTTPPGWITLDLQESMDLTRMRLLNWDWTHRLHRYQVEASLDGVTWTVVADASAADRHGWDDWDLTGVEARYLRFTGLSNDVHGAVCIAEWDVYGTPSGARQAAAVRIDRSEPVESTVVEDVGSIPVTVLTSDGPEDETGWLTLDGKSDTGWVGQQAGGGYIVIGYEPELELEALEIDMAEGSLIEFETLYSLDGEEWFPLGEALAEGPVELTYLWIVFPDDGTDAVPEILEIRTNP